MRLVGVLVLLLAAADAAFNVGVGTYDVTGPSAQVNLMGYANPAQVAGGIHMRLRSRAFVFQERDEATGATGNLVAFVSVDIGMGSDLLNTKVIEALNDRLGEGVITYDNLCISGTHSHSGPAGFLQYTLFQATSFGFVWETFDTFVAGIAESIARAHANLAPGKVSLAEGELHDSNINRSPTSYLLNPEDERAQYDADTDLNMLQLRLDGEDGTPLGAVNWFAVHGTSLNNTNKLLSGDNRGYASFLLEQEYNGDSETVAAGLGDFVAAFASTNLGDVSPNTMGAKCIDTGLPCDAKTSTCDGRNEKCIAFGPGTNGDMFESAEIIGRRQYDHASNLMQAPNMTEVSGPVDYRQTFINMSDRTVTLADGSTGRTCRPAMGYGFAAGTTDGPGAFNFHQATNETTPFWEFITDILSTPSDWQVECQAPKPILLDLSGIERPYQWDMEVVPIQLLRIGSHFIASVPSEFTTMAGRRLRSAIKDSLINGGIGLDRDEITVSIAGLANGYSDYVTTYEEYQGQRYEAASTIYGPHTHQAYVDALSDLAFALASGEPVTKEYSPVDMSDEMLEFLPALHEDKTPRGSEFGDIVDDVSASYAVNDTASATFWGANPRANQRIMDTFIEVQRQDGDAWTTVATDSDFSTKFSWFPQSRLRHSSHCTVEWTVPASAAGYSYRLLYHGDRTVKSGTESFDGVSSTFTVA